MKINSAFPWVGVLMAALSIAAFSCSRQDVVTGEAEVYHRFEGTPSQFLSAEGIAFDPHGNLFVSLRTLDGSVYQKNEIVRIAASGERVVLVDLGPVQPPGNGVLGLATDLDGNVYVAFAAGDEKTGVYRVQPDGLSERLPGSERINVPNSLSFDDRGNLYATDCYPTGPTDPGIVWRLVPGGAFEPWAMSELLAPDPVENPIGPPPPADPYAAPGANGIAFAPPNLVYVANTEKCLILEIPILPDGVAGDIRVVAGAYPPQGPPGLLFAPDGLAMGADGFVYSVVPPAGFTGPDLPLSPVIRIDPATGTVEPVVEPLLSPSPLFDFPTSLAVEPGSGDLYITGIGARTFGMEGSGPKVTRVRFRQ